jgi:hypothetical protein
MKMKGRGGRGTFDATQLLCFPPLPNFLKDRIPIRRALPHTVLPLLRDVVVVVLVHGGNDGSSEFFFLAVFCGGFHLGSSEPSLFARLNGGLEFGLDGGGGGV